MRARGGGGGCGLEAMCVHAGYPSIGIEAAFRNPRSECYRFLNEKHAGHYRVYNFCCEPGRIYSGHEFGGVCVCMCVL